MTDRSLQYLSLAHRAAQRGDHARARQAFRQAVEAQREERAAMKKEHRNGN